MKPGTEGLPLGSTTQSKPVDLALSVNEAVLWSFHFTDRDATWMSGMDALLGLHGATEQDVRAHLLGLVEPLTVAALSTPVWQDLELEQPLDSTTGRSRVISFRARRYGDQKTGGLIGVAREVSRFRDDRQAPTDLADRYRLLMELSSDAISVHQGGYVRYVNPACLAVVAAESDSQIVGHPITDFVDPHSVPGMCEGIASLDTAGAATAPAEAELLRVDHGAVLVESVSVRTSWNGRPAFQAIMRDITK
jgi:PAS domain S-box-containing protein